eukprot:2723564-Amphidinium_carterae.1
MDDGVDVQTGEEGLCPSPDIRVKALPGRMEGTVPPQTPQGGRRNAEFHSPQFGGESSELAAAAGASGNGGGGNGGSGP